MEYVRISETLDHPIGVVWAIVSGFGAIRAWIDGIESCSLEGAAVGSIRTVVRGGSVTRERLETIDPTRHIISYALIEPHRLPATGVRSTIQLNALDASHTRLTWWSEASEIHAPHDEIATFVGTFFAASVSRLSGLLGPPQG